MKSTLFSSVVASLLIAHSASAHPASELAVAVVKEQFKNALLVPQIFPTFEPTGTLTVNFSGTIITNGQSLPLDQVRVKPIIRIKGTEKAEATAGGPFNVTTDKYTILIVDAFAPGNTNNTSLVRHYLQNDLTYGENNDHSVLLVNTTQPITAYGGPNPPPGSGPHRYCVLAFLQPSNFTAPAGLNTPGVAISRFNPIEYIQSTGLQLLAAQYWTTEVAGNLTVSVAATSSVDSTTLPQPMA
ncbi:PEBP-like protein [Meredithblackwellia eburnea MCA 4105]